MSAERAAELVLRARDAEHVSREQAIALYDEALREDRGCLAAHNALDRLDAPSAYRRWMHLDCTIDERDDIYHFFANHPLAANPIREYLSDGWRTLSELMLLLERSGRSLSGTGSVLEFAAGFGRFTRHLAKAAPGRVTCAEIVPGAIDFLKAHFAVEAFESARDPAQIHWPRRYDLVFVLSLFTHLPLAAWPGWIRALGQAVAPGGVLVFTTHSPERALDQGVVFDADGARFFPSSESRALDAGDYGTTFTTRERALEETARALPHASVHIHPQVFWVGQDAVVVQP